LDHARNVAAGFHRRGILIGNSFVLFVFNKGIAAHGNYGYFAHSHPPVKVIGPKTER
jgi:hypothetical protein